MSELIYIDTNVWLDYFLNRTDTLRPLGDFAFAIFKRSLDCEFTIIISAFILYELKKTYNPTQLKSFIKTLKQKEKIIFVPYNSKDIMQAKKTPHWEDRLHELLAQKGGASFLVTRNIKDFKGDLVQIILPEHL